MKILNLTQHIATPDQVAAGVVEPTAKRAVQELLTFEELPTPQQIRGRADELAMRTAATGYTTAMIGGAPFFMPPLQSALQARGVKVLYAFSKRVSVDEKQADGSNKKTQVFRHAGFVAAVVL